MVAPMDETAQVHFAGEITWGTYQLTCRECGAARGWLLQLRTESGTRGETACAVCDSGHRMEHPLVYPRMVRILIAWALTPEDERPPAGHALDAIGWQPNKVEWLNDHDVLPDPRILPVAIYRPWTDPSGGYWQRYWPELIAAASSRA